MYGQWAMALGPMQSDFFMSKMLRIQAHIDCQELNANFDGIPSMVATHQMDYAGSSYRIFIGIYLKNQRLEKNRRNLVPVGRNIAWLILHRRTVDRFYAGKELL
jgi:hypothetical protein